MQLMVGEYEKALATLSRAKDIEPENPASYDLIAQAMARLDRFNEANGEHAEAVRRAPRQGSCL